MNKATWKLDITLENLAEDNARKWYIRQSIRALKLGETGVVVLPWRSYWPPIKDYVLAGLDIVAELGSIYGGDLCYITRNSIRIFIKDERQNISYLPASMKIIRWHG